MGREANQETLAANSDKTRGVLNGSDRIKGSNKDGLQHVKDFESCF